MKKTSASKKQKRILQIIGGLKIGGAETMLLDVLKRWNIRNGINEVLVFGDNSSEEYYTILSDLGIKIITITHPRDNYFRFLYELQFVIKTGKYAVVHIHTHLSSGLSVLVSAIARIPIRIVHSHSSESGGKRSLIYRIYEGVMKRLICCCATILVASSQEAGQYLFNNRPFKIIENGIDVQRFLFDNKKRNEIRKELGFYEDVMVLGHVGSFYEVKNQEFIVMLAKKMIAQGLNIKVLFIGDGPTMELVRKTVARQKISSSVIFLGIKTNVQDYLQAMDVFLFPSYYEGLGNALVEAQASGLPCIASDAVPHLSKVNYDCIFLPLKNPNLWINMVCDLINSDRSSSHRRVKITDFEKFSIGNVVEKWGLIYDQSSY